MVAKLQPPSPPAPPTPHALGGVHHDPDTLANLNLKVSDADLASVAALLAHAGLPTVHQDAPAIAAALIAVHAALPTVHQDAPAIAAALIAVHAGLTTGVHGVGAGTIGSVSTANRTIYVGKEATGAGDGTSWADAYTTIQDAVDNNVDMLLHAYTIKVRNGTRKTGTADANVLNKLHDTGEFPAATTWVGRRVFNVDGTGPGDNWGVISARDSNDQLSIVDIAGVALDLFPNGNEDYVIEPTPYRETVNLNSDPANHPAANVLGSLTIEGEHYWGGDCEANAVAGRIVDTGAFADVEVGDRIFVLDLNGANGRAQNYELGTVDALVDNNTIDTNLTATPTTSWRYTIVRTEISGSDDGTDGGTARDNCIIATGIDNITVYGFYFTFSDDAAVRFINSRTNIIYYCILEDTDGGIYAHSNSKVSIWYCYVTATLRFAVAGGEVSYIDCRYSVATAPSNYAIYGYRMCGVAFFYGYIFSSVQGVRPDDFSWIYLATSTIENTVTIGIYARYNATCKTLNITNNGTTPVDPVGTSEGAYIG